MFTSRQALAARALLSMQRHSWEQGTTMQAFLECGETDYVIAMAYDAVSRQLKDGRTAIMGNDEGATDPCSVGEALLYASAHTGDPLLEDGLKKLLSWALEKAPRNENGIVYHLVSKKQFWVDSIYMLPPFLTAAGYLKEAIKQLRGYAACLYDTEAHLMRHIWNDGDQTWERSLHWGSGNGWTLAAIARMLPALNKQNLNSSFDDDILYLKNLAIDLIEHLLIYLREDGFFHDIVDDPNTFVETNLSQMMAYAIYRGLADGWIDAKKEQGIRFRKAADQMRAAANQKLNPCGFIEGVCGAPTFDKAGISPEGQAFYLLMEEAVKSLSV